MTKNTELKTEKQIKEELDLNTQRLESMRTKSRSKIKRDGRVPLYKRQQSDIDPIPGKHVALITDRGNNLQQYLNAGYDFIEHNREGRVQDAGDFSQMGRFASQDIGNGDVGYYLQIPEEIYEENCKEKQKLDDEIMGRIKYGSQGDRPIAPIGQTYGEVTVQSDIKKS